MIPHGLIMDDARLQFINALRRNTHPEWVMTQVDTICEMTIWPTDTGPEPMLICGVRVPSPQIGRTLLCTAPIPLRADSPGDWDELVLGIVRGLIMMREGVIARLTGEVN